MTADMSLSIRKEAVLEIGPEIAEVDYVLARAWRRTGRPDWESRIRSVVGAQSARGNGR